MIDSRMRLSLADVAKLAGVQRPVVTMWRKRALEGKPFPAADEDGRFVPAEIVDWLEATGRGNNPDARADLAIRVANSGSVTPKHRGALIALLAARAMLDEPLAPLELDELVDEADALDPDDEFLFSELEALDIAAYPALAEQADAIADAAWHPRAAYERLLEAQPGRDDRLCPGLVELLAGVCRALLGSDGELIDVRGECCDVVIAACSDEDLWVPHIKTPDDGANRGVQRRYRVHGMAPVRRPIGGDWAVRPGSVVLIRVADEDGFELIDEARLQLAGDSFIVVVGPATLLTDALPPKLEARRDEFVRVDRPQPAVVQAAVRLPAGLTRGGSRQHLALWLLGPEPKPERRGGNSARMWVGDLSGESLDSNTRQALLDDVVAVARMPRGRAFTGLHAAQRAMLAAEGGPLVSTGRVTVTSMAADPAGDATRIADLSRALAAPMPEVFSHELAAIGDAVQQRHIRLGDAHRAKHLRLFPGARLAAELPHGATPLWTNEAVAKRRPVSIDLFALTRQHPSVRLTEPRDVVFTTAGKPAAVLDMDGGAAVAYPARILRVTGEMLCPAAIVDVINAVPAGNSKWRTWTVPETQIDPVLANEILESLHGWEKQLRYRQTLLDELRLLVTRSILSGAIQLTDPHEQKGP